MLLRNIDIVHKQCFVQESIWSVTSYSKDFGYAVTDYSCSSSHDTRCQNGTALCDKYHNESNLDLLVLPENVYDYNVTSVSVYGYSRAIYFVTK